MKRKKYSVSLNHGETLFSYNPDTQEDCIFYFRKIERVNDYYVFLTANEGKELYKFLFKVFKKRERKK